MQFGLTAKTETEGVYWKQSAEENTATYER